MCVCVCVGGGGGGGGGKGLGGVGGRVGGFETVKSHKMLFCGND